MTAPRPALPAIAPMAAPPPAPIRPPLTVRVPVVSPHAVSVRPVATTMVKTLNFMVRLLSARPLRGQTPNRADHRRVVHELAILLMADCPVHEGLDALIARGVLWIAY